MMGDCGCDAPKYSGGWCYGMWAGIGCDNRGKLWDTDRCGHIVIRYYDDGHCWVEYIKPKKTLRYRVKPNVELDRLKRMFAEFRDHYYGVWVDEENLKLVVRTFVEDEEVADLIPI